MKSFEQGLRPEETREVAELQPEKALAQEKSIFERFRGKAKEVAGVLILMSALSTAPGLATEAYTQEKEIPVKVEQIEKRKAVEEFVFREGTRDVKIEFLESDVEEALEEQNIRFNKKEGLFILLEEAKTIKFAEMNGVQTERVEVSVENIKLPVQGENKIIIKKIIKIKVYNSDKSVDIMTLSDGRIAGYTTEKPQK